jgi:hypothetical protein
LTYKERMKDKQFFKNTENKKILKSTMIKIALFTVASLFIGAGAFYVPKVNFKNAPTTPSNAPVPNTNPLDTAASKWDPDTSSTVELVSGSTAFNPSAPAIDQAKMLLRKVGLTGKCSSELAILDANFAERVGQTCEITRDQIRSYLNTNHVNEWEVGGTLDMPLSSVKDGNGNVTYAKYMVIHDTSFPRYNDDFPSDINDDTWEWNRLGRWVARVTHIYVNRIGDSKTMTPFHDGMTATKLERYVLGDGATRGLYLHIELIQPRKSRKGFGRHNDVDAPNPGFTDAQYKRLALLYTIASARKGEWLIPAFHACVDSGIKFAHDDPQNFELEKFFQYLNEIRTEAEGYTTTQNKVGSGSGGK